MAETYTFEDRTYIEPTVSRDEQLGFIDRLREIENKDLQKIAIDTHNLGSDLPSNLGGLSGTNPDAGSAGIWRNRYERPQTNALVAGLRSSAQASALNDVLNNAMNQYKNRYNQAYRKAKRLDWENSSNGTTDGTNGDEEDDIVTKPTDTKWTVDEITKNMIRNRWNALKNDEWLSDEEAAVKTYEEYLKGLGEDTSNWDGAQYLKRLREIAGHKGIDLSVY